MFNFHVIHILYTTVHGICKVHNQAFSYLPKYSAVQSTLNTDTVYGIFWTLVYAIKHFYVLGSKIPVYSTLYIKHTLISTIATLALLAMLHV